MERLKFIFSIFIFLLSQISIASPYYGATFSYVQVPKDPEHLHGAQLFLSYDPQCFQWRAFNLYFDGGVGQFWITNKPYYTNLTIYSLSPVVRYTFKKRGPIFPYIEFSIGPAYLNHLHLEDRNFGMHFSFQDRMGIGFYTGNKQQFSLGIHAVHYSNAHLAKYNSGVSALMEVDFGYKFSLM